MNHSTLHGVCRQPLARFRVLLRYLQHHCRSRDGFIVLSALPYALSRGGIAAATKISVGPLGLLAFDLGQGSSRELK